MNGLVAGIAQTIITPPVGVDLCGFAGRPAPSQGIHDDLYAKALYLSNESGEVVLITADLIGLSAEEVAFIREILFRELGLPPDAVMITCSHTHSGPSTRCIKWLGDWDEAYLAVLLRKIASVAIMAAKHTSPASVGWMREEVCIHVNRRERTKEGIRLGVRPDGLTLPWVDVLAVNGSGGRPLARWFSHAAHPVTLGGNNVLISADWPGYAQRAIEGAQAGCTALFAQGCCGNLNSHPRGTFEIAQQQGWIVAGAVVKAAALAQTTGEIVIDHASEIVSLPLQDPPPVEQAEKILQQKREALAQAGDDTAYQMRKTLAGYVKWAEELVDMARRGVKGMTIPFEIHAIRIGDTVIVGLPGEVFAEYAVNIAKVSPASHTVVVAYTNGNFGYVPTRQAFGEGGYEVDHAYHFYLPTMLTDQCEELILQGAERLLKSLLQ